MTSRSLVEEAYNPETPFSRLLQLWEIKDAEVRHALVDNPSIAIDESGEVTNQILLKLATEFPDEVAGCSAFALFGLELRERVIVEVANVLAEKAKDPSVLTILFHEFGLGDANFRRRIAKNPNTPHDLLRFMANKTNEPESAVRAEVAWNPNTPHEVLQFMADKNNEPEASVRRSVANNPSTPQDVLRFMADKTNHPDAHVRLGVAENPNTPRDVLRFLADKNNEPQDYVRGGVARNSNTPEDALRVLADETNEPDWIVRMNATQALRGRGLL